MEIRNAKTYKAMGFVEALIAIMIAGMASVVLMGIAARALKEAVQNERVDKMTEYAVEGANITRTIVEDNKTLVFSTAETCYIPVSSDGGKTWNFLMQSGLYWSKGISELVRNGVVQRSFLPTNSVPDIKIDGSFVRVSCIAKKGEYLTVKIYIAHLPSSGKITNDKEIKDYQYLTTINL